MAAKRNFIAYRRERYDELRTANLQAEGLRVIRFTNTEVMQNFDAVCEQILAALRDKP